MVSPPLAPEAPAAPDSPTPSTGATAPFSLPSVRPSFCKAKAAAAAAAQRSDNSNAHQQLAQQHQASPDQPTSRDNVIMRQSVQLQASMPFSARTIWRIPLTLKHLGT